MQFLFLAKTQSTQRKFKGEKPPIQKPCAQPEAYQVEVSGVAKAQRNSKSTARMFAGELSGPRQVSWSINPGAAGAWAFARKKVLASSRNGSAPEDAVFCFSPRRKARKGNSKAKSRRSTSLASSQAPDKHFRRAMPDAETGFGTSSGVRQARRLQGALTAKGLELVN
jgi:hypothetical protein